MVARHTTPNTVIPRFPGFLEALFSPFGGRSAGVRRAFGGSKITNARHAGGGGGHKDPSPLAASEGKNGGNPVTTAFGGVWRVLFSPPSFRSPRGSYVPGRFPSGGGCFSLRAAPDGSLLQPTTFFEV